MSALPRNGPDDRFCDRIKSMEQQITAKNTVITDKKPKDLLRAIGKIESNDWNIREIERKIELSKKTEVGKNREKVPKWSKEQFLQRQNKMAKPLEVTTEDRFKEIDQTIKNLDKQLKEGTVLERGERGKNKVASIAGALLTNAKKGVVDGAEEKSVHKSVSRSLCFKITAKMRTAKVPYGKTNKNVYKSDFDQREPAKFKRKKNTEI